MRRGEVWWADLPAPIGRRPVLLVSRDEAYLFGELIMVAPITTRIRGIPAEVALGPEQGLPKKCAANLETIRTISKRHLSEHITSLGPKKLGEVERALKFAFGLTG